MLSFGGFLNSTFWSHYRNQSSTSIEEILNSKECSVEKLLEDDDCLQEFKNLNDKLIGFFQQEQMIKLVDYITIMPQEDSDHNRGHKFPFIASEIFNCEINQLLDRFFEQKQEKEENQEEKKNIEEDNIEENKQEEEQKQEEDKKEEKQEIVNEEEKLKEREIEDRKNIVEPEAEDSTQQKDGLILLDRLFKFIQTEERPLNPVLSGYFCKLVTLFINKKQKQIIPYIFNDQRNIIKQMMYHVGQKSIADLLIKILNIQEHDDEMGQIVHQIQQEVIQDLIRRLGVDFGYDDNFNASIIIQDVLEIKEYYQLCESKQNLELIVKFILEENLENSSNIAAISVFNTILQFYIDKHKNQNNKKEDDDEQVNLGDDEEDINSNIIEVLKENLGFLSLLFDKFAPKQQFLNQFDRLRFIPFGTFRLKLLDMVYLVIKLQVKELYDSMCQTDVIYTLCKYIIEFPWNNFLQLKLINIFEEILQNSPFSQEQRKILLEKSKIASIIVDWTNEQRNQYNYESKRYIRHGYMAVLIKIGNLLQQNQSKEEVRQYIESIQESWDFFVQGQLQQSNENNTKSLGGQQPKSTLDDDDNDNSYEVNMEKIMARFSNFNTFIQSQNSQNSNNEEEEEKKEVEEQVKSDFFEMNQSKLEERELEQEYTDQRYWKNVDYLGKDLETLLAEEGMEL